MNKKGIVVLVCLLGVLLSILAPLFLKVTSQKDRYHQHIEAKLRPEDEVDDGTFNTHLPLVLINTKEEIPGSVMIDPVTQKKVLKENGFVAYTMAEDGGPTIHGDISVIDHEDRVNRPGDKPEISSDMQIRIRGNSSRNFEKKNYYIKLETKDGENRQEPLLGMDAHHEWALHGPYLDKSLLRNYMWYNIAGEIMDYSPNVRFCEVMINGEYKGLYVLTETITAGKDGSRLPITVNRKRDTFSGYLLRLDRGADEESTINSFTGYTYKRKHSLEIKYPGEANVTPAMKESIRQDFSKFEKALYSYDFDSEEYGYKKYIDTQSFVDYLLINEFTSNYDAGWLSTYMYKGINGKYRMCIWDFNSACDNYQHDSQQTLSQHYEFQNVLWYNMLLKDEEFVERLIDRYRELRETYFSKEYLEQYIDDVIAYLGPAIDRNYGVWGHTFEKEYDMLKPESRNPRNYKQTITDMKVYLDKRELWMDKNIETFRQYCNASRIKKFNENAN